MADLLRDLRHVARRIAFVVHPWICWRRPCVPCCGQWCHPLYRRNGRL
jgi:hypothetical protein